MKEGCQLRNPLKHEGTSQPGRALKDRDPKNVVLHDLGPGDWIEFAYHYADHINYFSSDDPDNPRGSWQNFFADKDEIMRFVNDYQDGEADPFFGLFISFLKLLSFPQKSLNDLPRRHLDYYYKEILRLEEKPSRPDKVHVIFELAKNAKDFLIEQGTVLDAGKDDAGESLHYVITNPVVVNPAKVAAIRSVYSDGKSLKYAYNPAHPEGKDEEGEEGRSWSPFGNQRWPKMQPCFYISSHLLNLKEGKRQVRLTLQFRGTVAAKLFEGIEIQFTGKKGWILSAITPDKANANALILEATVDAEEKPIVSYNEEVHHCGLQTAQPVMKVIFKNPESYTEITSIKLSKLSLEVEVNGAKSLDLKNDQGQIDPTNPFMPFGSSPKVGSKLKLRYDEMRRKPITSFTIHPEWLDSPKNFAVYYDKYWDRLTKAEQILEEMSYEKEKPSSKFSTRAEPVTQKEYSQRQVKNLPNERKELLNETYQKWQEKDGLKKEFTVNLNSPFGKRVGVALFNKEIKGTISGKSSENADIELELLKDFYHEQYNKVYVARTLELSKLTTGITPDLLPNFPYTPLMEELSLSYTAKVAKIFSKGNEKGSDGLNLFLQHPFGVEEAQEVYPSLVPDYSHKYLFIGLEKMQVGKNISLLFKIDEGSEDPETVPETPLKWQILSGNIWQEFEKKNIVRNDTNQFLRSGIVELQIPHSIQPNAGIMDKDLIWISIIQNKKSSLQSTGKLIKIHAQAALAIKKNSHAIKEWQALPSGIISQLLYKRSAIKTIEQPYPSYGGAGMETPSDFYQRVSERLRHNDRAVTIWDYEHLVLEQFPELYKVKCLNHSVQEKDKLKEFCPGEVSLVIIPKITNTESPLRFEPKTGRNLIEEIKKFLSKRISPHVTVHVLNPVYEKVRFEFEIEFAPGLDFEFHKLRAEEDLRKLLTPWAYDRSLEVKFDVSYSVYDIIHYLEKLEYVDFIEDFKMFHWVGGGEDQKELLTPGSPLAILISGAHTIKPLKNKC